MLVNHKLSYICDFCGTEIDNEPHLRTYASSHGHTSEICFNSGTFHVDDANYCNIECFFNHIRKYLDGQ